MQENKQTLIQLPQLTCARLNKATMVCASGKCKQSALFCMKNDCQVCRVNHRRCLVYDVNSLIDQIICKKQTITQQVRKAVQAIQKIYEDAIEKLSIEKQLASAKVQLFGLNEYEIELVKKMQDGLAIQIQGQLVLKVLKNLNVKKEFQATDQSLNKFWNKKKNEFDQLFDKLKQMTFKKPNHLDSQITEEMQQISCFFKQPIVNAQLLYRASENTFSVQKFHQKCDGVKNTMVLFKTEYDYIAGGFTNLAWGTNGSYARDDQGKTFIFSVTNKQKYKLTLPEYTIYCNSGYGPTFGGGHDLYIANSANLSRSSYFNVPHSYNIDTDAIVLKQEHQETVSEQTPQEDSESESSSSVKEPLRNKKKKILNPNRGVLNPRNFIGSPTDYYARIVEWEVFKLQF